MKVLQLINALSKLDPNAEVIINIKQHNKAYGKQVKIESTIERDGYETWVNPHYGGASITVHLPDKAIIANWPKHDLV